MVYSNGLRQFLQLHQVALTIFMTWPLICTTKSLNWPIQDAFNESIVLFFTFVPLGLIKSRKSAQGLESMDKTVMHSFPQSLKQLLQESLR